MGPDQPLPNSGRLHCGSRRRLAGLTLVEVMVSAAMIGLTCTVVMFAFAQLNQMSMITRLYSGACTYAQSQIDYLDTVTPFQPQNSSVPAGLTPGTTTTNVTVYQDPISGFTINGTMTTTVSTANTSYTSGSTTDTLYLYSATVTVTYQYRDRNYTVSLSTCRTSDV
ncbi:MAG: hypothetical protein ABSE62_00355 [Chthoniobacteraceae bacterium]|jgi:type II secretory pathway pseudopilin PulG